MPSFFWYGQKSQGIPSTCLNGSGSSLKWSVTHAITDGETDMTKYAFRLVIWQDGTLEGR